MEEISDLRKKREVLFMILQNEAQKLNHAREGFRQAKHDYEEVDREIAMLSRTILPPCGEPQRKQRKQKDLTVNELQQIANKLGLNIKIK